MRTKLLRAKEEVTVQLVYPSTVDEYREALDVLGRPVDADSAPADSEAAHAAYVVTTAQQRHLWGLPDLTVSGCAVPVDEARALDLLHDAAVNPDGAAELFPGRSPEVVSALEARTPGGSWFDAVRGFLSPGARVDQAVRALDRAGMPSAVHEALSDGVAHALGPGAEAAQAELDRVNSRHPSVRSGPAPDLSSPDLDEDDGCGGCGKPRPRGFPSSGGRALCVHGSAGVHGPGAGGRHCVRVA